MCDLERSVSSGGSAVGIPVGILEATLREQQTLRTPVALFSDEYDSKSVRERFTHLIPLSKPNPGEQYGFEVDLDACTGCKACVSACHSMNGLDEGETWRDTGVLLGGGSAPSFQQTITSACHRTPSDPGPSAGTEPMG